MSYAVINLYLIQLQSIIVAKDIKRKDLEKILTHLEKHSKKLQRMEDQDIKNTKRIERLEFFILTLHIVAILLVALELYLAFR